MASLKDIKHHIVAVKQTQKITKAMNMVAAAKLRATQGKAEAYQEYANEVSRLLAEVGRRSGAVADRIYAPAKDSDKALLVVLTSDRGLCGSFNTNILQRTDKTILELRAKGLNPELLLVGRKARDYYRRRKVEVIRVGSAGKEDPVKPGFEFAAARALTSCLIEAFTSAYKEIHLIYTTFLSLNKRPVVIQPFLPLAPAEPAAKDAGAGEAPAGEAKAGPPAGYLDFSVEPDPDQLLHFLIPNSLAISLYRASLDSVTAENASRMQAMDNASKSCSDIIQSLTMAYNKARQAAVTNELLDIVNGAEALKG
jgi:F-type H+-transporting ATPase subunit gamma